MFGTFERHNQMVLVLSNQRRLTLTLSPTLDYFSVQWYTTLGIFGNI